MTPAHRRYGRQGPLTDPGPHSSALDTLPDRITPLIAAVQSLLIHDAGLHLYGLTAADFPAASRTTLPISDRLGRLLAQGPLTDERQPRDRAHGTCRDYALLLTACLRHKSIPARVRCGFASYFRPGRWDDHWIVEAWHPVERRWTRTDAQLDAPHRAHLGVGFDITDMPDGAFLTAGEAWRLMRSGAAAPEDFGHGEARGEWFMRVNLGRDLLALIGSEVSDWDGWRAIPPVLRPLDEDARAWCDAVAEATSRTDQDPAALAALAKATPGPFWL